MPGTSPGRSTFARFDFTEHVTQESAWACTRMGEQVASEAVGDTGASARYNTGLRFYPTGVWTLRPLQDQISLARENDPQIAGPAGQFVFAPEHGDHTHPVDVLVFIAIDLQSYAMWKEPGGSGFVHTPGTLPSGDTFFQKKVPAGSSWGAVFAAPTVAPKTDTNVPMDCIGMTKHSSRENQGFCLRWLVPGTGMQQPDYVLFFGFGQYSLGIKGDGKAELWEYCRDAAGTYRWVQRAQFQYSRPAETSGVTHKLLIFPHFGANGEKHIVFSGAHLESSVGISGTGTGARNTFTQDWVYTASDLHRGTDYDESPEAVTKAAPIRLDIRRDLRVFFQISRLVYPITGTLTDQPSALPLSATDIPLTLDLFAKIPDTTDLALPFAINTTVRDAVTGLETGIKHPYIEFEFTGDTTDTPILRGYNLHRPTVTIDDGPGAFEALALSANVSAGDGDVRNASATVRIADFTNAFNRLANRGMLAAKVITTFTPPLSSEIEVVLHQGYAIRPERERWGKADAAVLRDSGITQGRQQGGLNNGANPVAAYPSPEASTYDVLMAGVWERLQEHDTRRALTLRFFSEDPDAPKDAKTGQRQPWKVTEVIKEGLRACGYSEEQINIADNPMRLWPGIRGTTNNLDQIIDINTEVGSFIIALARNYLGATLAWDANAGTDGGQWILLYSPPPGQTPVCHFVTYPAADDAPAHLLGQHPANTYFVKGPVKSYNIYPEHNHILVFTAPKLGAGGGVLFPAERHNHASYKVPGSLVVPDPLSPHYIGRERLIIVPEPTLYAGQGKANAAKTQAAVNFTCNRLFNYACRGRRVMPLETQLPIIQDAAGHWRPLRWGDAVSYNTATEWYARSCNPNITHSDNQEAFIEIELLEPLPHEAAAP